MLKLCIYKALVLMVIKDEINIWGLANDLIGSDCRMLRKYLYLQPHQQQSVVNQALAEAVKDLQVATIKGLVLAKSIVTVIAAFNS